MISAAMKKMISTETTSIRSQINELEDQLYRLNAVLGRSPRKYSKRVQVALNAVGGKYAALGTETKPKKRHRKVILKKNKDLICDSIVTLLKRKPLNGHEISLELNDKYDITLPLHSLKCLMWRMERDKKIKRDPASTYGNVRYSVK